MISYTKKNIETMVLKALSMPTEFYKQNVVGYKGKTSDTNELYSEVVSEILIKGLTPLTSIKAISRSNSYFVESHLSKKINLNSNREEEILAQKLLNCEILNLGKIFDFQIPLKDSILDKGVGKIDLVSYLHDKNIVNLIELKHAVSNENLLKAILQINTYERQLDKRKFLLDYKALIPSLNCNTIFKKVVLVEKASPQADEIRLLRCSPSTIPNLQNLIKLLDVSCYILSIEAV